MANPRWKQLLELGEAQISRIAGQVLANETFVQALQGAVSKTLEAKGTLDKSLRSALATMNLPSTADVEALRKRLDDLDRTLVELDEKLTRLDKKLAAPAKAPRAAKAPAKPRKKKTESES